MKMYVATIREWSKAQAEFTKSMAKIKKDFKMPESEKNTSVGKMFTAIGMALDHDVKHRGTVAGSMMKHSIDLDDFRHEQSKEKRRIEAEGKTLEKELEKATKKTAKAKKDYEKCCKSLEATIASRNKFQAGGRRGSMTSEAKLISKVANSMQALERSEVHYVKCTDELSQEQDSYRNSIARLQNQLQTITEKRVVQQKATVKQVYEELRHMHEEFMHAMEGLQECLGIIDPQRGLLLHKFCTPYEWSSISA